MNEIVLSLGSSAAYGVSDFVGGLKSRTLPLLSVLVVSQATGLAVLAVVLAATGDGAPATSYVLYALLAGAFEALGTAALYRGLAIGTMSIVAPVAALAPAVAVVASIALGEAPGAGQAVGIAVALGGVVVIARSRAARDDHAPARTSVAFGLLTAVGFGGYLLAMDGASEGGVPWALVLARVMVVTLFGAAFLLARRPLGVGRPQIGVLVLTGLLIAGADAMYAVATTRGIISVVAVLSSLYPAVTVALARVVLGERLVAAQRIGMVLVLAGVAAVVAF